MIRDLSLSLRALLTGASAGMAELQAAQIVFDRPSDTFSSSQPTLSVYLFDVRENVELRSNDSSLEWRQGQAVMRRAPLRVACSYVITAWPGASSGDEALLREHRLLSQALRVLASHPRLPAMYLQGQLANQELPLPLIAAPSEGLRNPSEFWTAVSNKLRPSLTITATFAMDVTEPVTAPPVVSSELRFKHQGRVVADGFRIGGRVTGAGDRALPGASVQVLGAALAAVTDAEGHWSLGQIGAGRHRLRVQQGGKSKEIDIEVPAADSGGYDLSIA